jgi:molybdopterin-guanine dinucleotide biosynthesis protein A
MNLTGMLLAGGRSSRFGLNKLDIRNCSIPLFIDQAIKLSFFCSYIIVVTSVSNYRIVAAEFEKIEGYFNFFYKYTNECFKVLKASGRNCRFPDKIPEIKVIVDEDFTACEQKTAGIISGMQDANKKDACEEDLEDGVKDHGPILGIYTGLKNAPDYYSLVLASDMPLVSYRLLQLLTVFLQRNFKGINKGKAQSPANADLCVKPEHTESYFTPVKKCRDIYTIKTSKGFEVLCGIYSKYCINVMAENINAKKNKISNIFNEIDTEILKESVLQANGIDDLNFFNINRLTDYDYFINIWNSKTLTQDSPPISTSREEVLYASAWAEFFFR